MAGACKGRLTGDVVDVRVYDDVEPLLGVVVLGNFCGSKLLRHDVKLCIVYIRREYKKCGREGKISHYLTLHTLPFPQSPGYDIGSGSKHLYLLPRQVQ